MITHLLFGRLTRGNKSRQRGLAIIYVGVLMLGAFGLVSLAVDLGRVRVGRVQLSTAADVWSCYVTAAMNASSSRGMSRPCGW